MSKVPYAVETLVEVGDVPYGFDQSRSNVNVSQGAIRRNCQQGRCGSAKLHGALVLCITSAVLFAPVSAHADDDDIENYTIEQVQACSDDAMRLCGNEIPDVRRIRDCMISKKPQLSAACQAMFK